MENREFLFEKMEEKQKEWNAQIQYLQAKAAGFDFETRERIENQINILNAKLKEIEAKTNKMKQTSNEAQPEIGDKIIYSWIELFAKIDNAMLRLKK